MNLTDWINVVSNVVMVGATVALVIYAALTVREAKRDRRKDTIEKMLEDAYSPPYEILRKAKFGNENRSVYRRTHGCEWVIDESEFARIREITEVYGHYFDRTKLGKFPLVLEKTRIWRETRMPPRLPRTGTYVVVTWHGFSEVDMSEHFDYIKSTRDKLMKELEDLTEV